MRIVFNYIFALLVSGPLVSDQKTFKSVSTIQLATSVCPKTHP